MSYYKHHRLRMVATMNKLVFIKIRLPPECLITNITGIRTVATMNKLVFIKIRLPPECLITHITAIWALTTM